MNIFSKVTHKTLKKNRTRTVVTIVGIILSAAMITAVTSSISSFERYLQKVMVAREGLWHGSFCYMPASDRERLDSDERVDSSAYAQIMGYSRVLDDPESHYPYLYVLGGDDTFFARMPVHLTAGRLPARPDEIVLRNGQAGDTKVELGGVVTLALGDRLLDGKILDTYDNYDTGEELHVNLIRTYTVVGFMSRPDYEDYDLPGQMALTYWDSEYDAPYLESRFLLKDPGDIFDFQKEFPAGAYKSNDNTDYLMTLGVVRYDTFYTVLYGMGAILIALIMFGSVSLIYNAFSISVAERTKQFGLLRSVGATKKQIRHMVFTEAAAVSAIGIPLGIISGILGMTVTFHFIGDDLKLLFDDGVSVTLRMYVTPTAVISAAVIGYVTVLISAWVPSRRAMKISAIEAIRQSGDVSVKRREVKTSKLTYKLFGLEGAIASKHFKRNRKRYRATVVSLFMSVVLFISASSFCRYLTDSVSSVFTNFDYDISLYSYRDSSDPNDTDPGSADLAALSEIFSDVSSVTGVTGVKILENVEKLELTRDMVPERTWDFLTGGADGWVSVSSYVNVYGVEDSAYLSYLRAHGLSENEYMGENPRLIVRGEIRGFNYDTERFEWYDLLRDDLDTLTLRFSDEDAVDEFYLTPEYGAMTPDEQDAAILERFTYTRTYDISLASDDLILGLNGRVALGTPVILMPLSEALELSGHSDSIRMFFTVSDHENALSQIVSAANDAGYSLTEGDFTDIYAQTSAQRSLVSVVRVISYGFITLISAIAALNVFNTISTNVLLRRREFAMLRSVGMTNRGFNRMMNFECVLYGTKSLIFGVPAAFALTYLMFRSVSEGLDTSFYLPWSAVAIAVGSVFLVVFATMMYSMSIVKRDNPVEAMKNEVI